MPKPATVLDLGSNIGLTMAHFAVLYPSARILGVELDPETAELARRNTARWASRCTVMTGAAWVREEVVGFERVLGSEFGSHVGGISTSSTLVQAYSIDTLVDRLGGAVDIVKMDIEGAEDEVMAINTGWAENVRSMSIEVHHGPEAIQTCAQRLRDLGFAVRAHERHRSGLVAIRQ